MVRIVGLYIMAQVIGAFAGVAAAHLMFSEHIRSGTAQWWSEFIATFGLFSVIIGCYYSRPSITPFTVGTYSILFFPFRAVTAK